MSYDIELVDPVTRERLTTPDDSVHHIKGGTYALGGTSDMWLNVTWNYSKIFQKAFQIDDGINILEGKSGAEAIPMLTEAISRLADDVDADYWKATEGNAKRALHGVLALCRMRPDGIIEIR